MTLQFAYWLYNATIIRVYSYPDSHTRIYIGGLQLLEYFPPSPTQQEVEAFQTAREENFQAQVKAQLLDLSTC